VPLQLPIGAEETFKGVVDLITKQAIVWDNENYGMTYKIVDIPADMVEQVEEYRQNLVEQVAEFDDKLMEKFFEDPNSITVEELKNAIRLATINMAIIPMMCGSSFKNKGVQAMLDAVIEFLPSPMDIEAVTGTNPKTDAEEIRRPDVSEPFAALAFKIMTDPFVGRLAFFRVYSGKLDAGSYVLNSRSGKKERISRVLQMHANKQNPIDSIEAGDIGAAVGFKEIRTGDTLCDESKPIVLEAMTFPEPVIGLAIEPKTQADIDKLGMALSKLAEEDPTFKVRYDEETAQTVISGMGELHLEIIVDRLRREFKVECNQGAPQVAFKESINTSASHRETYKKQTGGRGKFADIQFTIEPGDPEKGGLEFVDNVKGGNIPREFIPSVEKGFKAAMQNGVLAGFPVTSLKVTLTDGSYHAVDSDALSFEICAKIAYRESMIKCNPVLLEPIMKIEVLTPEENMGDVVGDLNKRRGQIEGMDSRGNARVIKGKVPLSEMFGYVTQLRTISSGRATSTMEFSHYDPAPRNVQEEVVSKAKGKKANA
jgi:elongation factor G